MSRYTISSLLLICLFAISCKNNKTTQQAEVNTKPLGVSWQDLYNTAELFQLHKSHYDTARIEFTEELKENKSTLQSKKVKAQAVDWAFWKKEFDAINLYQSKFDKQYNVTQFGEPKIGLLTTLVEALDANLPVRKMTINTYLADSRVKMLFVEYKDSGVSKKLTYVPFQTFQLVAMHQGHVNVHELKLKELN